MVCKAPNQTRLVNRLRETFLHMRVVIVECARGGDDLLFPAMLECETSHDRSELLSLRRMVQKGLTNFILPQKIV